ncbi:MAG: glycoside hydrolase family 127 protein [Clostridia bacterium]|nr:glycoside hydrolase family 127 protein [Clostridia bacterium]
MKTWELYTAKEIKPCGWLRRQLEIQAKGLNGQLDQVWPDVRDSAWIGGDREGWERVPYWLDGFIPLAYLLEDRDMISRAKKYIDAILNGQQADGWICPCSKEERGTYDTWAVQLIGKVLVNYYECSGDERVPEAVYRAFRNYYELLKSDAIKMGRWGNYRWFEAFIALNFLKERYDEAWIGELAVMLRERGVDYESLQDKWLRPINRHTLDTHIVNLAMMLKIQAVSCDLLGEAYSDQAEKLRTVLEWYNGTPVGLFTGDECLSGLSPIQGTELCAVVEQMYSYELLYAYTGDSKWAERLEVLAFNALPAAISEDMWTHQYVQMSNQISCEKFPGRSLFRTNNSEAHLFGLEPHYGCCTANFGQGWPKFALSAFMHKGSDIISAVPVPSQLNCDLAAITLRTEYPFRNELHYSVRAKKDFSLHVRVSGFAQNLKVNGELCENSGEVSFDLQAGEEKTIDIAFDAQAEFADRPYDLKCVRCGSLVFSLPIEYEKVMHEYTDKGVERKFPYCDYEYVGKDGWNMGFAGDNLTVERKDAAQSPFSETQPPVIVKAQMREIAWGLEDGFERVCAKVPESREATGEIKEVELYPYGCAKLRMTEMPMIIK